MNVEWKLSEVHHDTLEGNDRLLMVFDVPKQYAHTSVYSVSMPRTMGNDFAAVYEYDIDRESDVEALLDHLMYRAYILEVHRILKGHDKAFGHPLHENPHSVRSQVDAAVRAFKKSNPIGVVEKPKSSMFRMAASTDLLSMVREDLLANIDRPTVDRMTTEFRGFRRNRPMMMKAGEVLDGR